MAHRACVARASPRKALSVRRYLSALALFVILGPTPLTERTRPALNHSQIISARAVALDPQDSKRKNVGGLTFVEGWELTSANSDFGSYSAMALLGPRRFLLAGDNGVIAMFTLGQDGSIDRPVIAPLPDATGGEKRKALRDVESLTRDPVSGKFWVGFENVNQIWRYGVALQRAEARRRPPEMWHWPANSGPEGLARLSDGRFIALSEGADKDDRGTEGLLWASDPAEDGPKPLRFFYDSQGKGKATDVAQLPGGRLLILHRTLSLSKLFISTLAIADPADIRRDGVLTSRFVAELASPLISDNLEGVAVAQEGGQTILWLVSDDNLNRWQRTLLLKFSLAPAPDESGPAAANAKKAAPSPARLPQ